MSEIAIHAEGLAKQYRIGQRKAGSATIRDALVSMCSAPGRRLRRVLRGEQLDGPSEYMWAASNISRRSMFYETDKNNHGLPRNPYKSIVIPRPIGWI